jgi:hypothetical protein
MSEKINLTPYGIWYYGMFLDNLVAKLDTSLRGIVFFPPDVKKELEVLSGLKFVRDFEDIGDEVERWKLMPLDLNSCRTLFQRSIVWRDNFMQRVNRLLLIKPKLQTLQVDSFIKSAEELTDDIKIRDWLQEDPARATEFREACKSLLIGLPTGAGFYLVRLCERALRELYKKETGRDVGKMTWGAILDELEDY